MKNLLLITILLCFAFKGFSQDILLKRSGDQLKVKVTEVADEYIKYKKKGFENGPDFKMSTSDIFMLTFENGEKMMFEQSSSNNKKAEEKNFAILSGGTKVPLRMNETISSDKKGGRKVEIGEVISLRVQTDVTDIDGNVLVKQGTLVNGTITNSVKRKAAGTKGKLSFSVDFIKSSDGQSVPVNLKYDFAGKSKTGVAVAAGAVVAAPLLLIKGKPAIIKEGQVFNALVVGDKKIKIQD